MAQRTIRCSELYERVWSVPIKRLAPELGLSDVGLAKICRRCNIPVPPRGYWAQVQFGKAVKRAPLPPIAKPNQLIEWEVGRSPGSRTASRWERLLRKALESPPIAVPSGSLRHPLVRETTRHLAKGFPRAEAPKDTLRIEVSAQATDRSLRVMDALATACEAKGWSIQVEHKAHFGRPIARGGTWTVEKPDARNVSTSIGINRESVEIALVERFTRRAPTAADIRKHKQSYPHGVLAEVTAPTGELRLGVLAYGSLAGHRTVRDTATMKIEDQLKRFMVMLVKAAIASRRARVEHALRAREQRRMERRRAEAERVRQEQRNRKRILDVSMRTWRRQRMQRALLRALRRYAEEQGITEPAFVHWLSWAQSYVETSGMTTLVDRISAGTARGKAD